MPQAPIEVEAISGALMLVRREAIDDVGSWDENYFYIARIWIGVCDLSKNWKIVFVPDAPVTHFQGTCSRARPFFVAWHKHKGMLRFYRKFFQHQYPRALMGLVTFAIWFRFGITVIFYSLQNLYKLLKLKHA